MSKDNRFQKKAVQNSIVQHIKDGLPTKHNLKNTLFESGKDLVIGVLGGGLVGAAIGKPSLLIGLGVTGIGHFTDHHLMSLFGMGIMASNGFQTPAVSGLSGMDGVKERMAEYKENFAQKLYIHHLIPKKAVNGMGELQYFNYANDIDEHRNGLSEELNAFERKGEQDAMNYAKSTGMAMNETDMDDEDDADGYSHQDEVQQHKPSHSPSQEFDPSDHNI